jgi:hypothetical protein
MQTPRVLPLCSYDKLSHCRTVAIGAISFHDLCMLNTSYLGLELRSYEAGSYAPKPMCIDRREESLFLQDQFYNILYGARDVIFNEVSGAGLRVIIRRNS